MMEAVRTSETWVDNHFTRQYNPEDSSEQHALYISRRNSLLQCGQKSARITLRGADAN
jgi:hypothetical protein